MSIIDPKDLSELQDYESRKTRWEYRVAEYERMTKTVVAEETKMAVMQNCLAPAEVRRHLILNSTRITTYEGMKSEIESTLLADEAAESTQMDVGALMWNSDKGGKGKKGKKGKEKGGGKGKTKTGGDGVGHGGGGYQAGLSGADLMVCLPRLLEKLFSSTFPAFCSNFRNRPIGIAREFTPARTLYLPLPSPRRPDGPGAEPAWLRKLQTGNPPRTQGREKDEFAHTF